MVPYGIPPARVNDFYERYSRMRNPDTAGVGRVLQVEEAPAIVRPGTVLATRNARGEPVSRGGIEGPDLVQLGLDQLALDQAPPETTYSAQDLPDGRTVYTKRPFQALTGRTNFTPYGTISSRLEPEEERVAREWHEKVVLGAPVPEAGANITGNKVAGGTINGQPASNYQYVEEAVPAAPPDEIIVQPDPSFTQESFNAQAQNYRNSQAFQNPLATDITGAPYSQDKSFQGWEKAEDARRGPLGARADAYRNFTSDKQNREEDEITGRAIYKAAREQERIARTEQGRINRYGEMVPTRTSLGSPDMIKRQREKSLGIARDLRTGNTDAAIKGYQELVNGAVSGGPMQLNREQQFQDQQAKEGQQRLQLGEQANKRAQTEFDQEQKDRAEFQDSLMKWQGAQTEADRNRVIRESPALQKYFGVKVTQDEGISRTDYGVYSDRLRHLEGKSEKDITDEERQEIGFLRGAIGKYTQDEAKRQGITPKETPKATYQEGKVYGGMKFLGGDANDQKNWQKVR